MSSDNKILRSPLVYSETTLARAEQYDLAAGTCLVYTARSPFKETANEDTLAVIPVNERSAVLMIADGLGGLPAGEVASRTAIASLRLTLSATVADGASLREAILDGIERANSEIMALGTGCATTLAIVELHNGTMRSYHIGDSIIMLVGQRGRLKFQSVAHSPVGYAVKAGLLDETDAVHHEERNIVSNVLGSLDMHIDIGPIIAIAPHDTLLLASDGLPDNLYVDEIVSRIKSGPLQHAANSLIEECGRRMGGQIATPSHADDLSFILYRPRL